MPTSRNTRPLGEDNALVVRGIVADTVADLIEEPRLQKTVQERFQPDAHPVLTVVHVVDVAVIVGVIHGDFEVQPIEEQIIAFSVGDEAANRMIVSVRAAVATEIDLTQVCQAAKVAAGEEAEDDRFVAAVTAA